jgi:hypothetical protein
MIIDEYRPPVDDKLLYYIARKVDVYDISDVDELVQEGRIRVWQLWQEIQWVRTKSEKPPAWYAKAAQRRMQAVCYGHTRTFGGTPRPGYVDMINHIDISLDAENFVEPCPAM